MRDAAPDMLAAVQAFADVFGEIMETDEPLQGSDAVDAICNLWPAFKTALAKAGGHPVGARKGDDADALLRHLSPQSLDEAEGAFEVYPCRVTADDLLRLAGEYRDDAMIEESTFAEIAARCKPHMEG